jgi:PTH1 family peptidyl-tRNA hydrolase
MMIELVVGLGNPGQRYAASRHNVGFRVTEELARRHAEGRWLEHRLCEIVSTSIAPRLMIARPTTFMNRSGAAVSWLLRHLELRPEQAMIVVDDVDLPLAAIRVRRAGGPGTHNGLRDVCDRIGTGFPRIRVGVRGNDPWHDLAEYVLSPFSESELDCVSDAVGRACAAVEMAVRDGVDRAMNVFNRHRVDQDHE